MRVLIGYDGSACAADAIADLQRAGLPAHGTELLLLAVWDGFPVPPSPEPGAEPLPATAAVILRDVERLRSLGREALERSRATAEQEAARLRELFPTWSIAAEARADTPHWALVQKAAEWRADLVVIGSSGRSALSRVLLGSVSQQVLQNATCTVRIGRCDADRALPREPRVRLVLGVDGSADSASAVSAVAARHWPAGSEVLVVGVLDSQVMLNYLALNPPDGPSYRDATADASSDLQDALDRVCEELSRSGLSATASLLVGDPKKLLIEEAKRIDADCIVVGAKGRTRLERLLLGSVSASVAARAHCSVEVVRHG